MKVFGEFGNRELETRIRELLVAAHPEMAQADRDHGLRLAHGERSAFREGDSDSGVRAKYGLPCSACHTAWPELNNFGQVFRDNGYQLMNDRDSPIWQNPSYFPISFRITPDWHRESTSNQPVDSIPGGGRVRRWSRHSDTSGLRSFRNGPVVGRNPLQEHFLMLLPSSDSTAVWHFEAAWIRFDNLQGKPLAQRQVRADSNSTI